jgi:hypothetical protein
VTEVSLRCLWRLSWLMLGMVLMLTFGCATQGPPPPPVRDGQEQAVWIVWHEVYGRSDRPPIVRWKQGTDLVCTDRDSGKAGFWIVDYDPGSPDNAIRTVCREGWTWSPLDLTAAWHGELSFAQTVLAHELEHAELLRRGIFHGHHDRPDFFTRIDAANAALVQAGR